MFYKDNLYSRTVISNPIYFTFGQKQVCEYVCTVWKKQKNPFRNQNAISNNVTPNG